MCLVAVVVVVVVAPAGAVVDRFYIAHVILSE